MSSDDRLPDDVPRVFVQARDRYLTDKGYGEDGTSGNYRRNADRAITGFLAFLYTEDPQPPASFSELTEQHYRRFARYLSSGDFEASPVFTDALSNESANTYYAMVSGWTNWLTTEGYLDTHLAKRSAAREPLPDATTRNVRDQQAWTRDQRLTATRYLDHHVDHALDDTTHAINAIKPLRDRALVYVIAFTAVRGGEIVRDPNDDRRTGVRWSDVDLDNETLWVFPKTSTESLDDRALTPQCIQPLTRLRDALDPGPEWPVFPSLHWPTLYDGLRDAGVPDSVLDDVDDRRDIFALYREYDAVPRAMGTTGLRAMLKRLTADINESPDWPDLDLERGDYLQPHGGRRGAATALIRELGWEEAAEQLDNTVAVLKESYSHVTAAERSAAVGRAFDRHDSPDTDVDDGDRDGETGGGDGSEGPGDGGSAGMYPALEDVEADQE